ncbi:MAG: hypothetical protein GY702_00740 [Desulfobulbaceae bacterium]|nr:hypothetical protein [Desulfobulbaceae bacterium]
MPEAVFAALIGVGISLLNRYGLPRLDGFWLENCAKKPEEEDDSDDDGCSRRRRKSPTSSESADEMGAAFTSSVNQEMVHSSSTHVPDGHS